MTNSEHDNYTSAIPGNLPIDTAGLSEPNEPGLVSVIIPTYNRARLLARSVHSVLEQSYPKLEIIVVDDGSVDDTHTIIKGFKDSRIRYIRFEKNRGIPAARNRGIRAAKGEYIAFLDSDDEWLPNKLEMQIALFRKSSPSVGIVYCLNYVRNENTGHIWQTSSKEMRRGNLQSALLRGWCPGITSSAIVLAHALKKAGIFDESLPSFEDHDLWLRFAEFYEFDYVDKLLVVVHDHSGFRLGKDIEPRRKGLDQFIKKWGTTVELEAGAQALQQFRVKHLSDAYERAMWHSLAAGQRLRGLRYFFLLRRLVHVPVRCVLKVLLLAVGGRRVMNILKNIRR